jgi:hypothetical protein
VTQLSHLPPDPEGVLSGWAYAEEGFDLLPRYSASQPWLTAPTSIHAAEEPRRVTFMAANAAMRTSPTMESATGNNMMFLSSSEPNGQGPPQTLIGSGSSSNRTEERVKEVWHKPQSRNRRPHRPHDAAARSQSCLIGSPWRQP